jgi:anti-sigma-K factor RskA
MTSQLEELASLYVLDRLDTAERAAFEARLHQEPDLAELVRDLESALSHGIRTLPQHEPPATVLTRLEAEIDRQSALPATRVVPLWATVARWGIAAVIALGVGTIAVQEWRRGPPARSEPYVLIIGLDRAHSTLARLPVAGTSATSDARFIQLASLAQQYWTTPADLPAPVAADGRAGGGYAVFDPGTNQGFIAIRRMPAAADGKRYHLWVIDTVSGQAREAGALPAAGPGGGLYFFSVSPDQAAAPDRLDFSVTAEAASDGFLSRPRGQVVLGDNQF